MNRFWEMTENTPTQARSETFPIFHVQVFQTLSGILNICSFPAWFGTMTFAPKVCNIIRELLLPLVPVRQHSHGSLHFQLRALMSFEPCSKQRQESLLWSSFTNFCKNPVISQEMPAAALIQTSAIQTENFRKNSQFQQGPWFCLESPQWSLCISKFCLWT